MSQRVRCGWFRNTGLTDRLCHGFLNYTLMHVMAITNTSLAIPIMRSRRKDLLPAPQPIGIGILPRQSERKRCSAQSLPQVFVVLATYEFQMVEQSPLGTRRQHSHPILLTFAVSNPDLVACEIDVLHTHAQAFQQPQAGP